jgi:hypothetical protein
MSPDLIAMHMGALHPFEKVLTLLLAFGPFVVLGSVVALRRRHEGELVDPVEHPTQVSREG